MVRTKYPPIPWTDGSTDGQTDGRNGDDNTPPAIGRGVIKNQRIGTRAHISEEEVAACILHFQGPHPPVVIYEHDNASNIVDTNLVVCLPH